MHALPVVRGTKPLNNQKMIIGSWGTDARGVVWVTRLSSRDARVT
jgi:hypothetical protein